MPPTPTPNIPILRSNLPTCPPHPTPFSRPKQSTPPTRARVLPCLALPSSFAIAVQDAKSTFLPISTLFVFPVVLFIHYCQYCSVYILGYFRDVCGVHVSIFWISPHSPHSFVKYIWARGGGKGLWVGGWMGGHVGGKDAWGAWRLRYMC